MSFHGWTLRGFRGERTARQLYELLLRVTGQLPEPLYLGYEGHRRTTLQATSFADFYEILRQPGKLATESGRAAMGTRGGELGMHVEWSESSETPFGTIWGVVDEVWFDDSAVCNSFVTFCAELAAGIESEYFFAIHASDREAKSRIPNELQRKIDRGQAGNVPVYSAKPARYLPFVPWLMVLGPRYVEFFKSGRLERLACPRKEWLPGGSFLFVTADSPLKYRTAEVVATEEALRRELGDVFFDPQQPYRIPNGPDYPVVYRKWLRDLEEKWIHQPAQVWDASAGPEGIEVQERKAGTDSSQ